MLHVPWPLYLYNSFMFSVLPVISLYIHSIHTSMYKAQVVSLPPTLMPSTYYYPCCDTMLLQWSLPYVLSSYLQPSIRQLLYEWIVAWVDKWRE